MKQDIAILIVGAGPVGLTAALELARRGFKVKIIDAQTGPTPLQQSRALAIHARTLQVFETSGITESLLQQGNIVSSVQVKVNHQKAFKIDLGVLKNQYPFILTLPQGEVERTLIRRLDNFGIRVQWNTKFISQVHDTKKVQVTCLDQQEESMQSFDYVLGADGMHSKVRQSMGIDFSGVEMGEVFSLMDVELVEAIDSRQTIINMVHDGVVARFPITDRLVRYVFNGKGVEQFVNKKLISRVAWASNFTIAYKSVKTMQNGRVFIAGDAAHIHSPAGGQGMNLGIQDAAWFSWLLSNNQLDSYSTQRIPHADRVIEFTRKQTERASSKSRLLNIMLRSVVPIGIRIPWVHRAVVKQILALEASIPPH